MPTKKSAQARLYGLIGYPVKHSLSAFMHNAAFKALGINAEYRLFEIMPGAVGDFLRQLKAHNISGVNVTIPYKEEVLPLIDGYKSFEARRTGAVNTIRVEKDGKLSGFNTDAPGFGMSLKELEFNPSGKRISLIGAGGAAKAVSIQLAKSKPKLLSIYDVDLTKVERLSDNIKKHFPDCKLYLARRIEELDIKKADLLVNATPIGMKPDDPILVKKEDMHSGLLVYDLIYNPSETKLLRLAKEKGARVSNGLRMLLYQGMLAFTCWTGKRAPKDIMHKALLEGLNSVR